MGFAAAAAMLQSIKRGNIVSYINIQKTGWDVPLLSSNSTWVGPIYIYQGQVSSKFSDFEAEAIELNGSIAELEGEKITLTEEVERLSALLSKAEAKGTDISTEGDPAVVKNEVEKKEDAFWNGLVAKMNHNN